MRPWPPALAHSPRRPPSLSCSPSRACARFNETLMRENELFESHLRRVNPQLLTSDDDAPGKSKRKGAAAAKKAQAVLAPEQKYEIASQEMEEVRDEIEATKGCAERSRRPFQPPPPSGGAPWAFGLTLPFTWVPLQQL